MPLRLRRSGLEQGRLRRRICDHPAGLDDRERGQLVHRTNVTDAEMLDPPAPDHESVGYQPSVAASPDSLGAHDCGRPLARFRL